MNRYIVRVKVSGTEGQLFGAPGGSPGPKSMTIRAATMQEAITKGSEMMNRPSYTLEAVQMEDAGTSIILPPGTTPETIEAIHAQRGDTETKYAGPA